MGRPKNKEWTLQNKFERTAVSCCKLLVLMVLALLLHMLRCSITFHVRILRFGNYIFMIQVFVQHFFVVHTRFRCHWSFLLLIFTVHVYVSYSVISLFTPHSLIFQFAKVMYSSLHGLSVFRFSGVPTLDFPFLIFAACYVSCLSCFFIRLLHSLVFMLS